VSLPDKELRFTVPPEVENALLAECRAWNTDKTTVARRIMTEWAARKLHEAKLHVSLARANGIKPESDRNLAASSKVLNWETTPE
jgi:hypothetical protein